MKELPVSTLPVYMLPSTLMFLEELPLTNENWNEPHCLYQIIRDLT